MPAARTKKPTRKVTKQKASQSKSPEFPKLKQGDLIRIIWLDIRVDSTAADSVEPAIFQSEGRFVKWGQTEAHGRFLVHTDTMDLESKSFAFYGATAVPVGVLRSIEVIHEA